MLCFIYSENLNNFSAINAQLNFEKSSSKSKMTWKSVGKRNHIHETLKKTPTFKWSINWNAYFSENFHVTVEEIESGEFCKLLWTGDDQNHTFLKFYRIFIPIRNISKLTNIMNSISNDICIVAEKIWR